MQSSKLTAKQQLWQGHLEAQVRSGLTRRQYCEQHALDVQQMGYYVTFFKKRARAPRDLDDFIKLRGPTPVTSHLTIRLTNGISIECPTDARFVGEVLRSLT